MHLLPTLTVAAARALLAAGWTPAEDFGRVNAPIGQQPSAAHWVADWTWQAMVLMQLAAEPGKVRE